MGQVIEIDGTTVAGDVAAFHTDRSITGQDGVAFAAPDDAAAAESFPGDLAARVFDAADDLDHVFVASNQVVVRRSGGWDDASLGDMSGVIAAFFVFYRD